MSYNRRHIPFAVRTALIGIAIIMTIVLTAFAIQG